jgi:pimeloyl-ACP methyl ester carboxylesterase
LNQPALFVLGRQDTICRYEDYFSLLEKFPNASFAILGQARHLMQIGKRELVQELVKDWLHRIN